MWLDRHPIPDLFALLPFEWPGYLFHDVAAGAKLLGAGMDMEDPKFLNDFLIANAKRLGMAGKLLFPIPDRGLGERLYRVTAKTVLIWGEQDRLIPAAYGESFQAAIDGAQLVRVPQAAHCVTYEKPDAVLAALAKLN
jgi:pimeloyl-ACP methyl ester carboxylesterase